jgi:hypothetical protein
MIFDAFMDATIDTVKLLPFLFVTYLVMEYLEHRTGSASAALLEKSGKFGPLIGAVVGLFPQCGFSAAAASLFSGGVISLGTLIAAFLSTSDEMLPIFISEAVAPVTIAKILGTKALLGLISGLFIDLIIRQKRMQLSEKHIHDLCEHEHCHCDDDEDDDETDEEDAAEQTANAPEQPEQTERREMAEPSEKTFAEKAHAEDKLAAVSYPVNADSLNDNAEKVQRADDPEGTTRNQAVQTATSQQRSLQKSLDETHHVHHHHRGILWSALWHTLQITIFIFILTFIITVLVEGIGEDAIGSFLSGKPVVGVFLAGMVGLIPNCAASVAITQLYLMGILNAGQMMAGLLVGAGVGLLVLFRTNDHPNENLKILGILYTTGVFWGLMIESMGIVF